MGGDGVEGSSWPCRAVSSPPMKLRWAFNGLAATVVAAAGCGDKVPGGTPDPAPGPTRLDLSNQRTAGALRSHVWQKVTVIGRWDGRGVQSGYVYGVEPSVGEVVYLEAWDDWELDSQNRLYHIPDGTAGRGDGRAAPLRAAGIPAE